MPKKNKAAYANTLPNRDAYIAEYSDYIAASPTSFHAAAVAAAQLEKAGFTRLNEHEIWPVQQDTAAYVLRDGAVIAWRAGKNVTATSAFKIIGAHTDSPGFKIKPVPGSTSYGWSQLNVEIYGGPIIASWFDRDLAVAGQVFTRDGQVRLIHTGAIARIPELAIHLDRTVFAGNREINLQWHTKPILGNEEIDALEVIAEAAGVDPEDVLGWDLQLADTQAPARIGVNGDMLAAGRQDNLSATHPALAALIASEPAPDEIAMLATYDHEEVGSATHTGAAGSLLPDVLERIAEGLGATRSESALARAKSWILSIDAGHAVHPNYPEKHDPDVQPHFGEGPMLKINSNQNYATSAAGSALWRVLTEQSGAKSQVFVSNNAVTCGSTIGPISAVKVGIRTLDAGVPLLSMHSAREVSHVDDLYSMAQLAAAFFAGAGTETGE
ncbi:MAG: M18 family aminopeptidase [Microbacteriaceae bacterium]|nr:M18 family aminopeptidase [Microbacteriaceae bacterium]